MWPIRSKTSVFPLGATSTDIQLPSWTSYSILRESVEADIPDRVEQAADARRQRLMVRTFFIIDGQVSLGVGRGDAVPAVVQTKRQTQNAAEYADHADSLSTFLLLLWVFRLFSGSRGGLIGVPMTENLI